jgi:hypothetical protein
MRRLLIRGLRRCLREEGEGVHAKARREGKAAKRRKVGSLRGAEDAEMVGLGSAPA